MNSEPLIETKRTDLTKEEFTNVILQEMKPLSVRLIQKINRLPIFSYFHWSIICVFVSIISVTILGFPWILSGLREGPAAPATYIIGFSGGIIIMIVSFIATFQVYDLVSDYLTHAVTFLGIEQSLQDLPSWTDQCSFSNQLKYNIATASFFAIVIGFFTVITDKTNILSIASSAGGFYVIGLTTGSGVFLFLRTSSIGKLLLSKRKASFSLNPSETVGLKYITDMSFNTIMIGAVAAAIGLGLAILYLASSSSGLLNYTFIVTAWLVFAWGVEWFTINRTLRSVERYIRDAKYQTLAYLQGLIDEKYRALTNSNENTYGELDKLRQLYTEVRTSSSLPIQIGSIGKILTSIIIPILPILIEKLLH